MREFCHVDVFRLGLFSSMWNCGQIWPCAAELQQPLVWWQNIENRWAAGNAVGWKLTIFTIQHHQRLKAFLTIFEVDVVYPLGGISCCQRYRYDYDWILARRCLQAGNLIKHVNFGADWTLYLWVITTCCFMAKCAKWPPCHIHVIWWKLTDRKTFHREGLEIVLPKFEIDVMNSVGGVC